MKNIDPAKLKNIPTPYYLYDETAIRERTRSFLNAFSWNEGFKEHYAVKACPTPAILKMLKEEGCGVDCASAVEIELAKRCGFEGEAILFTSNETQEEDYLAALEAKAIINLDAYEQIENLKEACLHGNFPFPKTLCLRYNPGSFQVDASYIGELSSSKFGMREDQIMEAVKECSLQGTNTFGIHAMLAGNSLREDYYPLLAKEIFALVLKVRNETGITISFVDLAGGLGIPYKEEEKEPDIALVGRKVKAVYEEMIEREGLSLSLKSEAGRYITGPCAVLVSKVVGIKESYRNYVGIDASMADLMRPGMYGSYHKIAVLNDEKEEKIVDVVGPICENNDKFAISRKLPVCKKGDILLIKDVGAHGRSMGFNYNGRLRAGEYLLKEDGSIVMIRRRETIDDYFATLCF